MYKVVLLPKAKKTFAEAGAPLARKLARVLKLLETHPLRHPNVKPLVGPLRGFFRFRTGDYRIVYQIDTSKEIVYVVRIANRREVYD